MGSYQPGEGTKNQMYAQQEGIRRTVTLHDGQELDNDLGGRADHDLALAGLLGVVDGVERIVENGSLDHFGGLSKILNGEGRLRYLRRNCG